MKTLRLAVVLVALVVVVPWLWSGPGEAQVRAAACPLATWAPSCHAIPAAAKR